MYEAHESPDDDDQKTDDHQKTNDNENDITNDNDKSSSKQRVKIVFYDDIGSGSLSDDEEENEQDT